MRLALALALLLACPVSTADITIVDSFSPLKWGRSKLAEMAAMQYPGPPISRRIMAVARRPKRSAWGDAMKARVTIEYDLIGPKA
jgi:hypothetical protein